MAWNPCGRPVDLGSRPFKTKYRPFRDSDVEVEILWYPALRSAAPLPFASNITNPYWERDQYDFQEGPFDFDTVVPTGKPEFKPGTGRGHVCGTEEDFREGGHYDPLAPPVTYGMQGLPTCCGAPVLPPGGVIDGGKVGLVWPAVAGATCPTTLLLDLDVEYEVSIPGAGTWWVAWSPVGAGTSYYLNMPDYPGVGPWAVLNHKSGADCATSVAFFIIPGPGSLWTLVPPSSGLLWFEINAVGAAIFTVKLQTSP